MYWGVLVFLTNIFPQLSRFRASVWFFGNLYFLRTLAAIIHMNLILIKKKCVNVLCGPTFWPLWLAILPFAYTQWDLWIMVTQRSTERSVSEWLKFRNLERAFDLSSLWKTGKAPWKCRIALRFISRQRERLMKWTVPWPRTNFTGILVLRAEHCKQTYFEKCAKISMKLYMLCKPR